MMNRIRLFVCFVPLVLAGAGAHAQQAEQTDAPLFACDAAATDTLGRRACYARVLASAEARLASEVAALRAAAQAIEAPERRRAAVAAIDNANAAWRLLRDHDCAFETALSAQAADGSLVQIACAVARTEDRRADIASPDAVPAAFALLDAAAGPDLDTTAADAEDALAEDADAVVDAVIAEAATQADAGSPAPTVVAEERFRDWRVECLSDGACAAVTVMPDDASEAAQNALALRIERATPREDWRLRWIAVEPASRPNGPVGVAIDNLAPIRFEPGRDIGPTADESAFEFMAPLKTAAMFEGMRAGLTLAAEYANAEGALQRRRLSLRGLSAALDWIDAEQVELSN